MVSAGCHTLASLSQAAMQGRTRFYALIGVLWLCAGDDRLDVLPVRCLHTQLRRILRSRARLHPMDDHCRAVLTGAPPGCHVYCGTRQLDSKFPRWHRFPNDEGKCCI